jgi:SecD/SecF fusion protein
MSDRRRNLFVLLLVAGLLAASALALATKPTRLGLDLQGGVELVYQGKPTPQQPKITQDAINRALDIMRQRVDQLGVSEPEIQRSGRDQLVVSLPAVKNAARAQKVVGKTAQLFFYDWEPNVIGPSGKPAPDDPNSTGGPSAGTVGALSYYDAVKRAAKRPVQAGANHTTADQYYLVNDRAHTVVRGPEDTEAALFAERTARPPGTSVVKVNRGTVVVKWERPDKFKGPDRYYVLNDAPVLRGTEITNPKQQFNNEPGGNNAPNVTFDFASSKASNKFTDVTRTIAQRGQAQLLPGQSPDSAYQHFAIVLDQTLISVPRIEFNRFPDGIDARDGSSIEGGFTIQSAQDLASLLKTGALPIKLDLISQSQVSATLGKQALHQGLLAGIVGFAIVVLFLLLFYRVLGLIASAALGVYAAYFYALIKLVPVTLTLPGIAGLILTIGVAADANIVIFERVKEEIRLGRSVPAAIAAGYKKGLSAIIDANVVTIMTAFILFILATAGVKGFAFTLGIGVLVSLFTAVLATQAILGSMSRSRLITHPAALGAGEQRHRFRFDYMGASKWFFSMSGLILLIGALAIGDKGLNFGIDFESGTRIKTALVKPANEGQVRSVLATTGYADAKIQRISDKQLGSNVFQISTSTLQPSKVQQVRDALNKRFGVGNTFSSQSIGPTFGQTVAKSALYAIIASLLVISIYIAMRFEWKYAVPVLIALMHDVLITSGVYSLTGREVTTSTVAALLTILGYSLYDTIIVFDRIRENVPRMPRAAFSQIVNRSMSEVLTRSLATSFCTLLPVLALLLFGGETLKDFAFALLVGIASGTYSSIFIASPVLTHWKEREQVYARRTQRIRTEFGGLVPAYAGGVGADLPGEEPERAPRARLTTPTEPEQISKTEFDDLVRDLHADGARDSAADELDPEADAIVQSSARPAGRPPKPKRDKAKKPRNRRHGRRR